MTNVNQLITEHLDIWTSAIERRPGAGRRNGKALALYGIKKLRELILELAVRGKLAPQDVDEGTAESLLKALNMKKLALIASKQIKKPRNFGEKISKERHPVPENWAWVRLDTVGAVVGGGTPRADDPSNFDEPGQGFPWLTPADLSRYSDVYVERGERDLSENGLASSSATRMPQNTILFTSRAPIGYVAISAGPISTNQGFKSVVPYEPNMARYIALVLRCFAREIDAAAPGTTFKEVSGKIVAGLPFPLPPLAEQHRIIAKVDELMGLCDTLEAQAEDSLKAHQTLVETCLAALTSSQTPEDFAQNWARLAANFDALFTTEESVEKLRETIYLLAVQGKLVAQDPDEVSAQHLLQEVAGRRQELLEAGYPNEKEAKTQIKKSKKQTIPGDLPELPPGWEWATLMQASLMVIDCKNKTAPYSDDGVRLIRTTNVRNGLLNDTDQKYVDEVTYEAWSLRAKPEPGDLLITREAPMGEACLIPEGERLCLGQRMMLARFVPDTINKDYLLITFLAPDLMDRIQDKPLGMTVEHLRVGGVETLLVPVPPKAEQARIVDRVHRLVALCDEVKTRVQIAQGYQKALSDTLVERAA